MNKLRTVLRGLITTIFIIVAGCVLFMWAIISGVGKLVERIKYVINKLLYK